MFGDGGLDQTLKGAAALPVGEIVKGLMANVRTFMGTAPQSDDMTVLAVRYLG